MGQTIAHQNHGQRRLSIRSIPAIQYEPSSIFCTATISKYRTYEEEQYALRFMAVVKGRVDFFLSYQTRCRCLGVEYDERIYEKVMENKKEAVSKERVSFSLANAEEFQLPEQIDRIYFFNPFSVEILRKVMARIMESYYEHPRQILCFFYYPSDEYLTYLMTVDEMMFTDEIDCSDLFGGNSERERIMIFEIGQ